MSFCLYICSRVRLKCMYCRKNDYSCALNWIQRTFGAFFIISFFSFFPFGIPFTWNEGKLEYMPQIHHFQPLKSGRPSLYQLVTTLVTSVLRKKNCDIWWIDFYTIAIVFILFSFSAIFLLQLRKLWYLLCRLTEHNSKSLLNFLKFCRVKSVLWDSHSSLKCSQCN